MVTSYKPGKEYCRVVIDGFINEEAGFNGLLGFMIGTDKNGMNLIRLDNNFLIGESTIKAQTGEFSILWDTRRKRKPEKDEYAEYIKEAKMTKINESRLIEIIGDHTNDEFYR